MNAEKKQFEYAVPLAERISVQEIAHAAGTTDCQVGYQTGDACSVANANDWKIQPGE